jgi:branched-chain amino acid transport system substrate-binding protein
LVRRAARGWGVPVVIMASTLVLASCSNASSSSSSPSPQGSAPGVTKRAINVGALATLSGPLAADFAPIVPGVQAYFSMINAHGGLGGRKLNLSNIVDDGGSPSDNAAGARTLVQQDHVFAIVGVATFFFSGASFLTNAGTPTFGYATSSSWQGSKNLFGAYGSVLDDNSQGPPFAYVAHQVHASSVGVMAYNVPQSAGACQVALRVLRQSGINVGYSDLSAPLGGDMTPDALRMKQANVNFVISCMDVNGNVQISRALHQNGLANVPQLWLDGYNGTTLRQNAALMNNVYFEVQHLPFEASAQFPGVFPGLETYLAAMKKYAPQYVDSEVAMEGWISAATFVEGLKAAGPHPTQQAVISAINKLTSLSPGNVTVPINWVVGHDVATQPGCEAYVRTATDSRAAPAFRLVFNRGHDPWVCLNWKNGVNVNDLITPPKGSPGT